MISQRGFYCYGFPIWGFFFLLIRRSWFFFLHVFVEGVLFLDRIFLVFFFGGFVFILNIGFNSYFPGYWLNFGDFLSTLSSFSPFVFPS